MKTCIKFLALSCVVALMGLTAPGKVAVSGGGGGIAPLGPDNLAVDNDDADDAGQSFWRPHPELNTALTEALARGDLPQSVIDALPRSMRRELFGMNPELLAPHYRQEFQGRAEGGNPSAWIPDEPFKIDSMAVPSDQDVRIAIVNAVNWVLDQQEPDGSWKNVLVEGLLAQTADQAVDAVSYTALAGLALRPHVDVDPHRINPALKRGAEFVCARIIRGKLSTNVWYACWRYIFGLRFLTQEWAAEKARPTPDAVRMEELELVIKRMLQAVLTMQMSSKDQGNVDGSRKRKVRSVGVRGEAQAARLGILLAPPTDTDFRGGALVTGVEPGLPAEKSGIRAGDRVVRVDRHRVENAYDFYLYEAEFIEGQRREVTVARPEGDSVRNHKFNLHMVQRWPANIGVKVEAAGNNGVRVTGYTPASQVRKTVEIGDLIIKIGRVDLVPDPKKPEEGEVDWVQRFYEEEAKNMPRKALTIRIDRQGKKSNVSLKSDQVRPKPEGDLGFTPMEEDRASLIGVGIDEVVPGTPAERIGLAKGDRVIEINGTPILGWDHYYSYMSTLWMDTQLKIKFMKARFVFTDGDEGVTPISVLNDEAMYDIREEEFRAGSSIEPGDPQFGIRLVQAFGTILPAVSYVQPKGVSDGKLKVDDIIRKVGDMELEHFVMIFWAFRNYGPGDLVEITVNRGGKDITVEIELAKYTDEEEITAEGGWNYYPRGLGTSFTTAAAIIALNEVEETMKIAFPRTSMKLAVNALNSTRKPDPNGRGDGYIYDQRSMEGVPQDSVRRFSDIRGGMGRLIACEYALCLKDTKRNKRQLKAALDLWLQNRYWLDRVRNFWHTHFYPEYANAAYYWFYAHYHAVVAADYLDPRGRDRTVKKVQEDVLKAVMLKLDDRRPGTTGANRPPGTWVEHHAFGPLVGTCQALMCLGAIPGGFRTGYTPPRREETGIGNTGEETPPTPEDGGKSE